MSVTVVPGVLYELLTANLDNTYYISRIFVNILTRCTQQNALSASQVQRYFKFWLHE